MQYKMVRNHHSIRIFNGLRPSWGNLSFLWTSVTQTVRCSLQPGTCLWDALVWVFASVVAKALQYKSHLEILLRVGALECCYGSLFVEVTWSSLRHGTISMLFCGFLVFLMLRMQSRFFWVDFALCVSTTWALLVGTSLMITITWDVLADAGILKPNAQLLHTPSSGLGRLALLGESPVLVLSTVVALGACVVAQRAVASSPHQALQDLVGFCKHGLQQVFLEHCILLLVRCVSQPSIMNLGLLVLVLSVCVLLCWDAWRQHGSMAAAIAMQPFVVLSPHVVPGMNPGATKAIAAKASTCYPGRTEDELLDILSCAHVAAAECKRASATATLVNVCIFFINALSLVSSCQALRSRAPPEPTALLAVGTGTPAPVATAPGPSTPAPKAAGRKPKGKDTDTVVQEAPETAAMITTPWWLPMSRATAEYVLACMCCVQQLHNLAHQLHAFVL